MKTYGSTAHPFLKHRTRTILFRSFFACLFLSGSLNVMASDFEAPDQLKNSVEQFLMASLMQELSIEDSNDIQVRVSNLDPRLRLKRCTGLIQKIITTPKPYGTNVSVKLKCNDNQRWSIYVPAQVSIYERVAVLSVGLERGDIITEDDLSLKRMNTSTAGGGFIKNPSRLIGMQLKRRMNEGQALHQRHVKKAQIVKKGDRVVLEAGTQNLSVVTAGKALASGTIGQQIPVRNTRSNRIVEAKIVAPGRVKVTL